MKILLHKNSPYLFIIKFLLSFFVLYFFFPFYRGIIAPDGRLYSSYLQTHFNLVIQFTKLLTGCAKVVLEAAGYEVFQRNYNSLRIGHSRGVHVNPSCLGWAVISFWIAFVFANTGAASHKVKWMVAGIVSIIALNVLRIVLIIIANHLSWSGITSLDHHQTFNVASYVCIIILILWYIRVQKKYERNLLAARQTSHAIIPV
ncbi:MAG: exosortase/archaeosortase family protein [Bacteroidota bacterium]|nr:exosortase/archaeosortase family protein [Bacteroidota bacterium]